MAKLTGNRAISGTNGNIWVNGELWGECKAFEAKVTGEFEDVTFAGEYNKHAKYMGWTGEGTITLTKVYSRGMSIMADAFKKGVMPAIKIVGKLADPDAYGAERVALEEVVFKEFNILKFENRTIVEEELSFSFADYDVLEQIK